MGVLHYTDLELFLPGSAKSQIEFGICSGTDSRTYGNISAVAFYKRPVRFDGYCLFDWLLAAGLILYEN